MRNRLTVLCGWLLMFAWQPVPANAQPAAGQRLPLLVVLREIGATRNDLPVYDLNPDADRYALALSRGLSGRLLRLYALEQHYLQVKRGTEPEPAYLLASSRQGGFPRFGFFYGGTEKRAAGYVDLHSESNIGGHFGAMDQIFPHELGHVILVQLAGPPTRGGSNQMHAIGVRTDAVNAFSEGFAEHFQVLALDDRDALPETRSLLGTDFFERRTRRQLAEYVDELRSRWPVPGRRRVAFPIWFSGNEQALRYYAVKANAFARQPSIPASLLDDDPYAAYLLENILPGRPTDPPKTPAQLLSTEGVVAAFFVAWANDPFIQARRADAALYTAFGVSPDEVGPLENMYLKMFHAFFVSRPANLAAAIAGYKTCFPEETAALDGIARAISLGRTFEAPSPVWLANASFRVGTTMFDQFRSLPRTHTFDLNAASEVDLLAVPGVDRRVAEAIRHGVPYRTVEDVQRVAGVDRTLADRFRLLAARAKAMQDDPAAEESSLSVGAILRQYIWRLIALVVVAAFLGAAAYRLAVPRRWWRTVPCCAVAAVVALFLEIALDYPRGVMALVVPPLFFGIPGAIYCLVFPRRTARTLVPAGDRPPGRGRVAAAVLFAWGLAALPLVLLLAPHF